MTSDITEALALYDKDDARFFKLICAIKLAKMKFEEFTSEDEDSDALSNYYITIAHANDKEWLDLVGNSVSGTRKLRISNVGRKNDPSPTKSEGAYILSLAKPTPQMEVEDWQEVLKCLVSTEICEQLVADKAPDSLRKHFSGATLPVYDALAPICLLCQGYLAQLAEARGVAEPHPPQSEANIQVIGELGELPEGSQAKNLDWWRVFDANMDYEKEALQEWESLDEPKTSSYGWAQVESLLRAIKGGELITTSVVAEGYAALVQRFDG